MKIKDIAIEVSERIDDPKNSGYERFVGLEHYDSGSIRITRFGPTDNLDSTMKIFQTGDVLVARRNVYLKRAGIVDFDGLTSGDSIVLRAKKDIYQSILPFIVNSISFWKYAEQHADGSMSKRLSPKMLLDYEFSMPKKEIDIANICKALWAINRSIESIKTLIEKSESLIKALFLRSFGNPVDNDMKWPTIPMSSLIFKGDVVLPVKESYWNLNLDMIESTSGRIIRKVYSQKDDLGPSVYPFGPEMVLYSKLRPYLNKVAITDEAGFATTELVPLAPKQAGLLNNFTAELLRGMPFVDYVNALSAGARMPRTPMKDFREFRVIKPPIDLQRGYEETVLSTRTSIEKLNDELAENQVLLLQVLEKELAAKR